MSSQRHGQESRYGTDVPVSESPVALRIDGCVGRPATMSWSDLGGPGAWIGLIDVLSMVRLAPEAAVLATEGPAGERLMIPVSAALGTDAAVVVTPAGPAIDVPGWTPPGRPIGIRSLRAITFREFLGCA